MRGQRFSHIRHGILNEKLCCVRLRHPKMLARDSLMTLGQGPTEHFRCFVLHARGAVVSDTGLVIWILSFIPHDGWMLYNTISTPWEGYSTLPFD